MTLLVENHGAVRVLTLNRPERRNSLNPELLGALGSELRTACTDPSVRAVMLAAAGEKAFCAGMDLAAFAALGAEAFEVETGMELLLDSPYPKPVVAAVQGPALAGGFELVLGCDVVIASREATFGLPEARRGLVAAGGGLRRLPGRVGLSRALDMALRGLPITAEQAFACGLVREVTDSETLYGRALAVASDLAAAAPLAVAATKKILLSAAGEHVLTTAETDALVEAVFASEDALEGATAFAEKREPQWTGR